MDIDTKLGHYKILNKIGKGGMGEVFLAQDTKLGRKVALKILPFEFAADSDRMNRFVREAQSASALNHPNIITIHEIGESAGTHFIATEFIDGKTLNDYVKDNSLNYKSALEIVIQVASALDEAHQAGIVHRDIKPDNIMIRASGLVKILDFGIAKLAARGETGEDAATAIQAQTQAGMIIGTPNYMSPEQARGRDVDHQTDIFSFGVVFYEMLSGASPFTGETISDVLAAVLTKEPPRLANVPPELADILDKTLQKDKRNRYQTAKDLLHDLREVKQELEFQDKLERTSPPNRAEVKTQILKAQTTAEDNPQSAIENLKSVVVLPFTNISTDEDNEYFSDGLTEEIISDLSKIRALRVISRNSAMKLKGTTKDLRTITEELNVRYVLDGSVRKAGQSLRISVQLIDGATDANLWAEKYSGSLDDIFEIQESVSRSIAEALKITLTTGEIEQIEERPIADAQAYDLYLQARAKFWQGNSATLDRSIELLKQGLDIIGENELLYAALGYTYYFYFRWISKLDENYLRLANECLEKTFALNPASSHGFSLKGMLSYSAGNIAEAIRSLEKAVRLQPTNTEALIWLAIYGEYIEGYYEASMKRVDEVRLLDPLMPINTVIKGFVYIFNGEFKEPLLWIERGLAIDASAPLIIWAATIAKAWCGKIDEAIAHADRLAELAPGWVYTEHALFLKHALRGEKELALQHYTPDFDKEAQYDCHFALHVAHCFALISEKEKALDFLEISVRTGMVNYPFLSRFDPLLENIRHEQRFNELMREAKQLFERINNSVFSDAQKSSASKELSNLDEPPTQILKASTTAKEITPQGVTLSGNSIAVLPFTNMSADDENEYFCDGLAEELLNALSKIEDLKVAARTSAFSFKGKDANASEIGEKLNVKNILEGSVRRSGNKLRISVQLINAANGFQLWSERYDREMKDIFDVQDEIALAVVDALKLKLFGNEKAAVLKRYTNNAEAYQLYLNGRFFFLKRTPEGFKKAIDYFEKAIECDSEYALAYAGIADSYVLLGFYEGMTPAEAREHAKPAVYKAIELDNTIAETHTSVAGYLVFCEWEFVKATAEFEEAIRINPKYTLARHFYAGDLVVIGSPDEVIAQQSRSVEIEPFTAIFRANYSWYLYLIRRNDLAIEQALRTIEIAPDHFFAYWSLGLAYALIGKYDESLAALQKASTLTVGNQHLLGEIARVSALSGKQDEAVKILDKLLQQSKTSYVSAVNIAKVYAGFGEREKFLEWLEKAYEERAVKLPHFLTDPCLDDFRDDERFQAILKKMNLPTNEIRKTDESLEAKTVMLSVRIKDEGGRMIKAKQTASDSSFIPQPSSFKKWWLFGLLGLIVLVVGFFGYKYFAPTGKQINSIAVLPFENKSSDADSDYLSDGLAESLIYRLSQLPDLKVSPTSSVFRYKGKSTDPQIVAKELGVDSVLTGRITQRGDNLNISVNLVDTRNGKSLWGEQYERKMSELLTTQREIAAEITNKLQLKLSGEEKGLTKRYTDNNEAYQLYLKGRYSFAKRTKDEMLKAVEYYRQAIALDPNFALAYARIAEVYNQMPAYPYLAPNESFPKAKSAAQRALEIDPNLGEAHTAMGNYLGLYERKWTEAETEFKRGLEIDPNSSASHFRYAQTYLIPLGRTDEALTEINRALEIEPLDLNTRANFSWFYLYARQNDKALAEAKRMYELDPNFVLARYTLGLTYNANGMYADTIDLNQKFLETNPTNQYLLRNTGYAYAKSGRRQEAEEIIKRLKDLSQTQYVMSFWIAGIYTALGDKDKAFAELEKGFDQNDLFIVYLKVDPQMDFLRDDPRYRDLLKRMNLPE